MMKEVEIFTDGACLGNPGAGGWCAILKYKNQKKVIKGYKRYTTNNEMELTAVINALKQLKEPCKVNLYCDSQYVLNGISKWLKNWEKNNWKNSSKKEIANKNLWIELNELIKIHNVDTIWIKGHSGHKENEFCDKIAKEMAQKVK